MHGLHIFGLVCLRLNRTADENSNRIHPVRMYRHAFDIGSADTVLYTCTGSMHGLHIFGLVCLRLNRTADEDG